MVYARFRDSHASTQYAYGLFGITSGYESRQYGGFLSQFSKAAIRQSTVLEDVFKYRILINVLLVRGSWICLHPIVLGMILSCW